MHKKLICPLLNKACIKDKCAWWSPFLKKNLVTNETEDASKCVIVKSMDIQLENLHRTVGIQQVAEETRNNNQKVQSTFLNMLASKKKEALPG